MGNEQSQEQQPNQQVNQSPYQGNQQQNYYQNQPQQDVNGINQNPTLNKQFSFQQQQEVQNDNINMQGGGSNKKKAIFGNAQTNQNNNNNTDNYLNNVNQSGGVRNNYNNNNNININNNKNNNNNNNNINNNNINNNNYMNNNMQIVDNYPKKRKLFDNGGKKPGVLVQQIQQRDNYFIEVRQPGLQPMMRDEAETNSNKPNQVLFGKAGVGLNQNSIFESHLNINNSNILGNSVFNSSQFKGKNRQPVFHDTSVYNFNPFEDLQSRQRLTQQQIPKQLNLQYGALNSTILGPLNNTNNDESRMYNNNRQQASYAPGQRILQSNVRADLISPIREIGSKGDLNNKNSMYATFSPERDRTSSQHNNALRYSNNLAATNNQFRTTPNKRIFV